MSNARLSLLKGPNMSSSASGGGVNRAHDRSLASKLIFAGLHAVIVALCFWVAIAIDWADPVRATVLAACAALYFLRHLVTLFVLLKRKVALSEVLGLTAFMAFFEIGFLLLGAGVLRSSDLPFGIVDAIALTLVVVGSFLNTGSELQRWKWKKHPSAKGRCYTQGLFKYSAHINYFGDVVLFSGWAMLTLSPLAFVVPVAMAAGFIFFHIPALDAYLSRRYGVEFDTYAARTAKLVPFIY